MSRAALSRESQELLDSDPRELSPGLREERAALRRHVDAADRVNAVLARLDTAAVVIHYYVKRETAGDGTLWQAYGDADNLPVCLPTTEAAAVAVARERSLTEGQRAWDAADPYERGLMSDASGT